ncbi:MAG: hypothetical protein H7Y42_10315 [Chitinophagaceae bacterium]|nr:hypothetical protein [Chitinophagaceae bacterium]
MRLTSFVITLILSSSLIAQEGAVWRAASKESEEYHEYRVKPTVPPHGLAKVKALIKDIKVDEDDTEALARNVYESLSLREKFTYNMIHAESYSQNCDANPPIQEEHKKIFGYLPDAFGEYAWSDRQSGFLRANRDSVISLMKESITRSKRVGVNFKHAIIEINAREMIPFIIAAYAEIKKDLDLLTVLLLLMKENEYDPFIASASYRKLYSDESNYAAFLVFSKGNEELIIKRATDFYNAGKK